MLQKDNPTSSVLLRGNKRLTMLVLGTLSVLGLFLLTFSRQWGINHCRTSGGLRTLNEAMAFTSSSFTSSSDDTRARFIDLNGLQATGQAKDNEEHVLILTPLKNAASYLPRYFELVDRMSYPKHLISLAFLVSDTTDDTVAILKEKAEQFTGNNNDPQQERYHSISIFEKNFDFVLPEDRRHEFEMQPLRRSFMARSRNYLLSAALKDEHAWVLWLDVDVVEYPPTILEDLQSVNVDVVVPNCLRETEDNSFWGYDKNNWQETKHSLEMQKDLDPDYVLLEGYYEFLTGRYLMVDMPTHLGKLDKVPLDGVGATFTLVKAQVHREGANFPPYAFQHQVETEGFAKMAKAMGFGDKFKNYDKKNHRNKNHDDSGGHENEFIEEEYKEMVSSS
ncbi:Anp1-domain-containing protein [Halteromyces radiatus]|uniref:Anp1-domain-containing protein n=1 Tax=Halteromyces radiatus TaxID=101107 RepID=UPI00221F150E|nr:Anp1-domain-containing protein [Halteromyces radiatus]KAI8093042.1 Anp1-domain-containing protein [Halteromyces radiatus]